MSSAAGDIAVQNRLGWGYLITDKPKSSYLCPKGTGKVAFLMSDLCKSSSVSVQKILVPNLVNVKTLPLKQSLFFSLGFDIQI
jgi:hypothetical protein